MLINFYGIEIFDFMIIMKLDWEIFGNELLVERSDWIMEVKKRKEKNNKIMLSYRLN